MVPGPAIQVVELPDLLDSGQSPVREIRMSVGQFQEITPLVRPAEGQNKVVEDSREFLVGRVAVTDDDSPGATG